MSAAFSNLDYLYDNLPARMRRDDDGLLLKRLLSPIGNELDVIDLKIDTFYQNIDPATALAEYVQWWLYALFNWGWFPTWFTLAQRRAFYAAIASQHYPERGTLIGIKNFLAAFGLRCIVEGEPRFRGEFTLGESQWTCPGPMVIIVRLVPYAPAVDEEGIFCGDSFLGDEFYATPSRSVQIQDVDALLRFVWPLAQHIFIEHMPFRTPAEYRTLAGVGYGTGEYGEAEYGG
jgi:phage tail-like protein